VCACARVCRRCARGPRTPDTSVRTPDTSVRTPDTSVRTPATSVRGWCTVSIFSDVVTGAEALGTLGGHYPTFTKLDEGAANLPFADACGSGYHALRHLVAAARRDHQAHTHCTIGAGEQVRDQGLAELGHSGMIIGR